MNLNEVLNLSKTESSIKKIDLYLSKSIMYSNEFMAALKYKAEIISFLGEPNKAIKMLADYMPYFDKMDNESIIITLDGIINITLSLSLFEQADNFIELKKKYLPISKSSLYLKDRINFYLLKNDKENAKAILKQYLSDDITKEESILAKENLAKIYFDEKDYDSYLPISDELLEYYRSKIDIKNEEEILINQNFIDYQKGQYLKVISSCNELYKNLDIIPHKLRISSIAINSYLKLGDTKKASIFEADCADLISEEYPKESLEFIDASLNLYQTTGSKLLTENYLKLKENYLKLTDDKPKKKKKKDEEIKVVIPVKKYEELNIVSNLDILNKEENDNPIIGIKEKKEEISIALVSKTYDDLSNIFKKLNLLNKDLRFREYLRLALIEITKYFNIEEAYFLYFDNIYKGLYFKAERLYDKTPIIDEIQNTISYYTLENEVESSYDQASRLYDIDIRTSSSMLDDYAISFPIVDELEGKASLTFFSHNPILDKEMVYESLKIFTSFITSRFSYHMIKNDFAYKNQKLFTILDNMTIGIKEESDYYIHLDDKAKEIFDSLSDITFDDFILNVDNKDKVLYKNFHDDFLRNDVNNKFITYHYNANGILKEIKESFYQIEIEGKIYLLSLVEDISNEEAKHNELKELAYINPVSKLENEVKFRVDLAALASLERVCVASFNIRDFKTYKLYYGYSFEVGLIKLVSKFLKEKMSSFFNANIYHFYQDSFVLVFRSVTDKRVSINDIKKILSPLIKELYDYNYRLSVRFDVGMYRVTRQDVLKYRNANDLINIVIDRANDALIDAKKMPLDDIRIASFDNELSKIRHEENYYVKSICEALDNKKIDLFYKQVINVEKGVINFLYLNPKLTNMDYSISDIVKLLRKRSLESEFDYYIIKSLFNDIAHLQKEINKEAFVPYIFDIISLNIDEKLASYIITEAQRLKINPTKIIINGHNLKQDAYKLLKNNKFHLASIDLSDVLNDRCEYYIYDYHKNSIKSGEEILNICNNHNIKVIFNAIDCDNDVEEVKSIGAHFVYGDRYQKHFTNEEFINKLLKVKNK